MSRQRYVQAFEKNSKLGVMKKRIIGTAEIKQILANEYFDNSMLPITKLRIDDMVKCFKNSTDHITKRIFIQMMEYLDVYVHRWGKLSSEVVAFMMFKGLDRKSVGEITYNGCTTDLKMYLESFSEIVPGKSSEKATEIIEKLKPVFYGKVYAKYDTSKIGVTTPIVRKLLIDIFQIEKTITPSLIILVNALAKDNLVSLSKFLIICNALEWVIERTQHLTILEMFTAIFYVLDKEYRGVVPVETIKLFLTQIGSSVAVMSTCPDYQLVEFLHYAETISENIFDFKKFYEHIFVPVNDLKSLSPLTLIQTKKTVPVFVGTTKGKTEFLKEVFDKLEIDIRLQSRILDELQIEEKTPEVINFVSKVFNENVRKYGRDEGVVRAIFFTFQYHGIDSESLVLCSKILGMEIDKNSADFVIQAFVEDDTDKLNVDNFVRYWMNLDYPRVDDTPSEKASKLTKRTLSMFRALEHNGFVTKDKITEFIAKQYGSLSFEEIQCITILFNYLSSFKEELTFSQFKLFMVAYERSMGTTTLSLELTTECICNAIWNSRQFQILPALFNITQDDLKTFNAKCQAEKKDPSPKEFTSFVVPLIQKTQIF
ncbi:hypothetical protein EIN_054910 [Entamoeba invadens IP1]|uniref:hypothetical protein n=1 Tax=Entamoeba invadens IP1 TaxID=370355 RepID=UPI0002C3CF94|nr:hypothetical protein EIN_054910 [Entamoeba invadens IP1]ELP93196.1 hypothetical protein EIN_054910 [Entamoeba invadens IP1]|eukprot:XP_004259967.1 hypothetical protein EIN_054910 [Entamoeba invadens IP1]